MGFEKHGPKQAHSSFDSTHLGNRSMLEKLVSSSHVTCEDEADERRGVTVTTGNQVVAVPI